MLFRERQQKIIYIAVVALVGGFLLFRYLPLRKNMASVNASVDEAQQAVAKVSSESEELPKLKDRLVEMQEMLGDYDKNIPDQRDLGAFLQQLANLMSSQDLTGQQIQPGREINTDDLNCIPIQMKCKGRLTQIFAFYKSLQGMDRFVRIESIKIVNDRDFSGEVSMEAMAVIYYKS